MRAAAGDLPDGTVLDGEIVAWKDEAPMPFSALQTRIGRKSVSGRTLRDAPALFMAYDLLEQGGADIRTHALGVRRQALEGMLALVRSDRIRLDAIVRGEDWTALAALRAGSRERGVEGLMLKRLESAYGTGRRAGDWWKWKICPLTIDCVLTYAQTGRGRRANLLTDYTFAVWDERHTVGAATESATESPAGPALVTLAKAYSGLSDQEIAEVDRWIRAHTIDRFGPVRRVTPELVCEIAFDSAQRSTRHKAGGALRFPRIARWRRDKQAKEADTLDTARGFVRG